MAPSAFMSYQLLPSGSSPEGHWRQQIIKHDLSIIIYYYYCFTLIWIAHYDYVMIMSLSPEISRVLWLTSLSQIWVPHQFRHLGCVFPYMLYILRRLSGSQSWLQILRVSFVHYWTVNESPGLVQINFMSSFMSHNRSTQSLVNSLFWLIQREPERREACLETGRSHGDTTHHSGVQEKKYLVKDCVHWNTVYQSMHGLLSFQKLYYI